MKHCLPAIRRSLVLMAFALALPPALPGMAGAAETPAAQSVGREIRCPVCGMYPARYPKWMAQAVFKDRSMQAFDSPADLFRYLNDVHRRDRGRSAGDIGAIYLTDYLKGGWVESSRAWLVSGSSVRGPMNNADLPAFGTREDAEAFARANGGKALRFEQVTPALVDGPGGTLDHGHHGQHHSH